MLNARDKRIVECIIKHCLNIEEDTADITEEDFDKDRITQNSICFDILQIGGIGQILI